MASDVQCLLYPPPVPILLIPDVLLNWMLWAVFHTCAAMAFLGSAFVTAFLCSVMCVFSCFHISRCTLSHIHIACSRPCTSVPPEVLDS